MTLRDRYAKNFAEALDFTQRRPAIDLPPYDPPPARVRHRRRVARASGLARRLGKGHLRWTSECRL